MRNTNLTAEQIINLAGVRPTGPANRYLKRDLLKLATWCANNLVLEEEDCPDCGQPECELCVRCQEPECGCVCECDKCHQWRRDCTCPLQS